MLGLFSSLADYSQYLWATSYMTENELEAFITDDGKVRSFSTNFCSISFRTMLEIFNFEKFTIQWET